MIIKKPSFGEKIVLDYLSSIKIPITKAELIEKYGEKIIMADWHRGRGILLKDLFGVNRVEVFHSKSELAMELNKIYNQFKRGLFW